jgi:hypothetical protein
LVESYVKKAKEGSAEVQSIDEDRDHEVTSRSVGDVDYSGLDLILFVYGGVDYLFIGSLHPHAGKQDYEDDYDKCRDDASSGGGILALPIVSQ